MAIHKIKREYFDMTTNITSVDDFVIFNISELQELPSPVKLEFNSRNIIYENKEGETGVK